jgi:nucleoside-diphosphate-sugar epimerase
MTRPLVLVTGGAGFLGSQLCRFLLALGFAVRSLDCARPRSAEPASIEFIRGDIRDVAVVAAAMRGVGYVVHAAAAAATQPDDVICSTGVMGTWNVLQMAARERVARVVFLSSSAVYGAQEHHLMHEMDELHGCDPYAASKIEAENLCHGARLGGLCVSILRCTDIIGPGRAGILGQLFDRAARGQHFPMLGSGRQACQVLDVEDVCDAIYLCLVMRAGLVNDTFNLGAADYTAVRDSFQAVLDSAGFGKRVIGLPEVPAAAVLALLESLGLGTSCPWSRVTVGAENSLSVRHIQNKLAFRPRFSARAALVRHYSNYLTKVSHHDFTETQASPAVRRHPLRWLGACVELVDR